MEFKQISGKLALHLMIAANIFVLCGCGKESTTDIDQTIPEAETVETQEEIVALDPVSDETTPLDDEEETNEVVEKVEDAVEPSIIGTIITMGTYEQDGDKSNGAEPVEWIVLDENENGILVASCYILDCKQFEYYKLGMMMNAKTWDKCTLRKWLNNDFYNSAFSSGEKEKIIKSTISTSGYNAQGLDSEIITDDFVFCLSFEELLSCYKYKQPNVSEYMSQECMIEPTQNAINNGLKTYTMTEDDYNTSDYIQYYYTRDCIGKNCGGWWLRTPSGIDGGLALYVTAAGVFGYADRIQSETIGVRPAMYISSIE